MWLVKCPSCGNGMEVPEEYSGRKAKCRNCSNAFVIQKPQPEPVFREIVAEKDVSTAAEENLRFLLTVSRMIASFGFVGVVALVLSGMAAFRESVPLAVSAFFAAVVSGLSLFFQSAFVEALCAVARVIVQIEMNTRPGK